MAVSETIREAGAVPSGHLYAALISKVDLEGYQRLIRTLENAQLVEKRGDMLRWIGPDRIAKGGR
jgi:hypothetical protein